FQDVLAPLRRGFPCLAAEPFAALRISLLRKNGNPSAISTCALRPRFGGAFPLWKGNQIPRPRIVSPEGRQEGNHGPSSPAHRRAGLFFIGRRPRRGGGLRRRGPESIILRWTITAG